MKAKEQILGAVRRSLKREGVPAADAAVIDARLAARPRGPVPQRGQLPPAERAALFVAQAESVEASVARVDSLDDVPGAVAAYLREQNLPSTLKLAPDPTLTGLPWAAKAPMLKLEAGRASGSDEVSLTAAFAGVAETGTLMLVSGERGPTTLNFLPETHLVVLRASQVVGPYEDAWDRLRAANPNGVLPRTVNFVTGPSRTGDIEQRIELGAHGPRRLHIVLVEDDT
jgi:L-lactate dehydrogenase complex protein LldG